MYAKSFMTPDGNGCLTGARTAQQYPYDRYTCLLSNHAPWFHPQHDTERPLFESQPDSQAKNGQQRCPYVKPEPKEARHIRQLNVMYRIPVRWFTGMTDTAVAAAAITMVNATA